MPLSCRITVRIIVMGRQLKCSKTNRAMNVQEQVREDTNRGNLVKRFDPHWPNKPRLPLLRVALPGLKSQRVGRDLRAILGRLHHRPHPLPLLKLAKRALAPTQKGLQRQGVANQRRRVGPIHAELPGARAHRPRRREHQVLGHERSQLWPD